MWSRCEAPSSPSLDVKGDLNFLVSGYPWCIQPDSAAHLLMTPLGQTVHHWHPAPLQASHEGPSAASTNAPAGCNEPDTSHVPALLTAQQLKPKSWGLGAARTRGRGRGRRKHAPSRSEMDLSPAGQQRALPTHPRVSRHPSHHGNPSVCTSGTLLVPLSKPAGLMAAPGPPRGAAAAAR